MENRMDESLRNKMTETADFIFRHPEVSLREGESSRALAEMLEGDGIYRTVGQRKACYRIPCGI